MNIINITTGNNVSRKTVPATSDTTIRDFCEANGIEYARGGLHLDGAPLGAGDLAPLHGVASGQVVGRREMSDAPVGELHVDRGAGPDERGFPHQAFFA